MNPDVAKNLELKKFDASDYLNSPEECAAYLQEFIHDDEGEDQSRLLLIALGDIVKAKRRTSQISKEVGISREGLYKALGPNGNPSFRTIAQVLRQLGLEFSVHPSSPGNKEAAVAG